MLVDSLIKMNEGSGFSSFSFLIERDSEVWVFHPADKIIGGERHSIDYGECRWRFSDLGLEQASHRHGMLS